MMKYAFRHTDCQREAESAGIGFVTGRKRVSLRSSGGENAVCPRLVADAVRFTLQNRREYRRHCAVMNKGGTAERDGISCRFVLSRRVCATTDGAAFYFVIRKQLSGGFSGARVLYRCPPRRGSTETSIPMKGMVIK